MNEVYLESERAYLDKPTGKAIIVIADLGLWNGRYDGYEIIRSGNLKDIFDVRDDLMTWYVDADGELRCDGKHHDGVNHYWYRFVNCSEEKMNELCADIYCGSFTKEEIEECTSSVGEYLADRYGWEVA